jgi:hypothetical protein
MTKQSNLSRTLQMTLCAAAAACAMGTVNAQTQAPAKLVESSSTQTPVQASPTQARSTDGRANVPSTGTTAPSKSSMEARQPAQASPTNARSTDGRKDKDMSSSHSGTSHGASQSSMEAMKPTQASPSTTGSPTGR